MRMRVRLTPLPIIVFLDDKIEPGGQAVSGLRNEQLDDGGGRLVVVARKFLPDNSIGTLGED